MKQKYKRFLHWRWYFSFSRNAIFETLARGRKDEWFLDFRRFISDDISVWSLVCLFSPLAGRRRNRGSLTEHFKTNKLQHMWNKDFYLAKKRRSTHFKDRLFKKKNRSGGMRLRLQGAIQSENRQRMQQYRFKIQIFERTPAYVYMISELHFITGSSTKKTHLDSDINRNSLISNSIIMQLIWQ